MSIDFIITLFVVGMFGAVLGAVFSLFSIKDNSKEVEKIHKHQLQEKDNEIEFWKQKFIGETRK
jgi:predicted membrane protein